LKKENPQLFTNKLDVEFRNMMQTAVEHEIQWGQYVTNNQILGLNNELIDRYIKYISNLRLTAIGLEPLYPEVSEHPMEWIDSFSRLNNTKTDFFEAKVTNYTKSAAFDFDDLD
ncbi:MAG: ribonucleotide-diphosphate reductase subunit beta, partial [Clostridiaceae bacterium]|nr:ribonucleotide-diphosphate reductase subunit beta [Clostridiaceae bacterium]